MLSWSMCIINFICIWCGDHRDLNSFPTRRSSDLEDHVEVGANTVIDRATLGSTTIRKGVKLDNLIQIAHNVEIGANTVVAAQTGISGSIQIGKKVVLGRKVGVEGHY